MVTIKIGETGEPIVTRLVAEDKVPWYRKRNLRYMYFFLFLCCMGVEMTSGFDSQLINTLQFSGPFNKYFGDGYVDDDGKPAIEPALLGFISSCYQLGSILAVPVAPWFNQRFGRRWSIMAGSLIMVVGAILQGFSQHVGMYIIARMLLGVGIVFAIISGSALIGELGYPKERPVLTSLFNASYFVGAIIAAAISIKTVDIVGDWSWRIPSLLQICPSLLQICCVFLIPESPRWLVSKDRHDEAYAILTKYHAEGDPNSLIVAAEMAEIRSTIKLELENSKQSWMDMLRTAGMRRRVFISCMLGLFTQMSGNTLLSYYSNLLFGMMGYTTNYAKTRINIANQCWSLINGVTIALVVTRFRRRWMFMLSSTSMLLVFIGMTVSFHSLRVAKDAGTKNGSAAIAALFFYFAYSPCYNIGNNSLTYTFLVELFPYAQRTMGIGVEQIFGKLGGFFSVNVNPIALDAIGWKFFAIYCGWITFEFLTVFFFYPETYNRTLEELAFLFEDKALIEKQAATVEKQIHEEHEHPAGEKHGATTVERSV
ncbi:hexose transporter-like protein [Trematosphaeria pertusa]|uniref:Hexose transporter-like protein n=1 Tax=Trematosphaeria pertusa TaxID=390896 RepID=A0A6A6IID9_9PLEO|nr:hexose transporter-like protein [Trematosphaeria pertusa]KAF2249323.1 hexose transporter-like protein [Trematosphaeria pertusa]